jgi:hypothetical protein
MISTALRIVFGLLIGMAVCVAFLIALCTDLVATETKPLPRRARLARMRPALQSMEARS